MIMWLVVFLCVAITLECLNNSVKDRWVYVEPLFLMATGHLDADNSDK